MEQGFNSLDQYEKHRPQYGSVDLNFDPHQFLQEALDTWSSPQAKRSGRNDFNRFNSVGADTKHYLSEYFNDELELDYDWNWEYFHSGEPAGLHTDYVSFPNSWKPNKEYITHDCYLVLGVIIPMEWTCKQPYTVNYTRTSTVPRKLIYKQGEMRYTDNNEVFEYRGSKQWDPLVEQYNPRGTQYYGEYEDLEFHSAYEWKVGTAMLFDTARWHSSSWYLSTNQLPEQSTEYKRSIIGFASIDVDR